CPLQETVIDYIGGVADIRKKKVVPLIPPGRIFSEDPVRMIRAVKYSAGLGFRLPFLVRRRIKGQAKLLADISGSRLTEELFKILQSGKSCAIFRGLFDLNLLNYFLPELGGRVTRDSKFRGAFFDSLAAHDAAAGQGMERRLLLAPLIHDYVKNLLDEAEGEKPLFRDVYHCVKKMLRPIVPANKDIDAALLPFFRRKKQDRRRRRQRGGRRDQAAGESSSRGAADSGFAAGVVAASPGGK
ncbi:MAG: hypothetical protein FWG35_03625, partial [Spirochaetaceae bacterium]|nr:hypothetical protein [Spirochaetaceae bacterium]